MEQCFDRCSLFAHPEKRPCKGPPDDVNDGCGERQPKRILDVLTFLCLGNVISLRKSPPPFLRRSHAVPLLCDRLLHALVSLIPAPWAAGSFATADCWGRRINFSGTGDPAGRKGRKATGSSALANRASFSGYVFLLANRAIEWHDRIGGNESRNNLKRESLPIRHEHQRPQDPQQTDSNHYL